MSRPASLRNISMSRAMLSACDDSSLSALPHKLMSMDDVEHVSYVRNDMDEAEVSPMAQKDEVLVSLLEKLAHDGVWEAQLFMADHFALDKSEREKWRSAAWETMTETTTGSDSAEVSLVGENYPSLSASFLSSLEKAAEDDDHTAQLMVGRAYRTGVGKIVGKNTYYAFKYLQAAISGGVEEAKDECRKLFYK